MSPGPAFSVIIPTYDRAEILPRAISSVLHQTLDDFELIVVDDGSTDATPAVLARLNDPRVRCFRQQNRGVSAARNLGLLHARGAAVTFLDSDDEAEPEWLATLADALADPGTGIATVGARVVPAEGSRGETEEEIWLPRPLGPLFANRSLRYTPPGTLAVRRELLMSVGGYAEAVRFAENSELAMRLVPACLERGLEVMAVDRPLVVYHRDASAWRVGRAAFESMRTGAEYVLTHHGDRLRALAPAAYANYRGVAGVNAARLGEMRAARRHLLAAIRAEPRRWQSYLRLALTVVPPLGKRYWTRHAADRSDADAST